MSSISKAPTKTISLLDDDSNLLLKQQIEKNTKSFDKDEVFDDIKTKLLKQIKLKKTGQL